LILYESPKRINRLLTEMADAFGKDRLAAVCRELTKRFEDVSRGTLGQLSEAFAGRAVKGEIVVLVDRPGDRVVDQASIETALRDALARGSVKDAAAEVSAALNLPRKDVYRMALQLAERE
jgi:16S rRNA (cytidine1402-2'-O)-methyltransferase